MKEAGPSSSPEEEARFKRSERLSRMTLQGDATIVNSTMVTSEWPKDGAVFYQSTLEEGVQ
jgi:hypothetical protein